MDLKLIPQFKDEPEKALDFYHEYGFTIEYNVWSPEECAHLREAARRVSNFDQTTLTPLMQMQEESLDFAQALRNPRIVSIMEKLVSGRVSCLQTQFFFAKPGTRGFAKHQDNHYVEAPEDRFASAWSALEDVDQENGALIVYPRSHKSGIFPVRDNPNFQEDQGQDPNAAKQELVLPEEFERQALVATIPAGATLFIHAHLVHSSLNNTSTGRTRNALLMTYLCQGEQFRSGARARRREIDVYSL